MCLGFSKPHIEIMEPVDRVGRAMASWVLSYREGGGESGGQAGGGVRAKLGQEKRGTWYAVETLNPTPVSLNAQP